MTKPRRQQVSLSDTPYYHITSRCVRRAFLCGNDGLQCYDHRRQWITDRIRLLASIFTIDICSYAVMSNHYHLVLKLNSSEELSDAEVLTRWLTLFKGPLLIQQLQQNKPLSSAQMLTINDIITVWRTRLGDISWFMKCLNEPIARAANKEDSCTGHFWESRFTSQALLTQEALLTCMAYVDLNPIRAKMATTPETSDYTSVQERIKPQFNLSNAIKEQLLATHFSLPVKPLLKFDDNIQQHKQTGILFSLSDYLQLVDFTGRIIRSDKRGAIPQNLPPILTRLNIPLELWLINSQQFEQVVRRRFKPTG